MLFFLNFGGIISYLGIFVSGAGGNIIFVRQEKKTDQVKYLIRLKQDWQDCQSLAQA